MTSKKPTKTLDVIAAVKGKGEVVVAGEVAEIHFPKGASLSLLASKLFVQLLDVAGAKVCEPGEHRTTLESLNWSHRETAEIEETVRELQRTIVELTVDTSRGKVRKSGPVLTDVARDLDATTGELVWEFSKTFRNVVRNSKHWAAISARAVLLMEGKYSPWLYQLAALHAGRREVSRDWPLHELRERLGATAPSLRRWINFRNFVLEPAVAEVNHLTGVRIDWQPVKRGRTVVAVRLACWRKDDKEIKEATAEQARPRPGRKVRREGKVEEVAAEKEEIRRMIDRSLASPLPPSIE